MSKRKNWQPENLTKYLLDHSPEMMLVLRGHLLLEGIAALREAVGSGGVSTVEDALRASKQKAKRKGGN